MKQALILCLVLALPVAASAQDFNIKLRGGAPFDPLAGGRYAALAAIRAPQDPGFRLLQFNGPVLPSWKAAVESAGGRLLDYVPEDTFIVRMDSAAEQAVRAFPFVRWIGPLPAEDRLAPELLQSSGTIVATVKVFPGESLDGVLQRAAELGLTAGAPSGDYVGVQGDAGTIRQLVALPEVSWIEPAGRPRLCNDRSRVILGVPPVWQDFGLYGDGETVAVMDSGLDTGNLKTLSPDFAGRVVDAVGYNADNDWADRLGHGTHVAGTILGNGLLSGSDPDNNKYARSYAGIAPKANMVVLELDSNSSGSTFADFKPDTDLTPILDRGYKDGARLQNDSWLDDNVPPDGTSPHQIYNFHAQQLDQYVWNHPDYSIFFAAGNEGNDGVTQQQVDAALGIDPNNPPDPNMLVDNCLANLLTGGDLGSLTDPNGLGSLLSGNSGNNNPNDPLNNPSLTMPGGTSSSGCSLLDGLNQLDTLMQMGTGVVQLGEIGAPATAKDVVAVGATEGNRPHGQGWGGYSDQQWSALAFFKPPISDGYLSDNPDGMAAFSSRGPTADGRIKPDLVAPGTNIISALSSLANHNILWGADDSSRIVDSHYAYLGGTSMSTPMATGSATLVREYLQKERGFADPSAALIKGLMINGARDINPGQYGDGAMREIPGPRPNDVEGWGRIDLANTLDAPAPQGTELHDVTPGLNTGESKNYTLHVTSSVAPLKVTLAWSDYPATPAAAKSLVNDLDLTVKAPDGTLLPGNGAPDHVNNVEGVDIATPVVGDYEVTVKGYNVPQGPQPYALIASGAIQGAPLVSHLAGDVNGDGKVTVADAVLALRFALGLQVPTEAQLVAADVAPSPGTLGRQVGDGQITLGDVTRILRHAVGADSGQTWP